MKQKKWFALLMPAVLTLVLLSCNQKPEKKESVDSNSTANQPVVHQHPKTPVKSLLVGEWARTDAPYQLKISEMSDGGTIKVGYFNPKSINVGKAGWIFSDGTMKIYLELRDENYPGSNYNLIYNTDKDQLEGKYFQAVEGVTYDVVFLRAK